LCALQKGHAEDAHPGEILRVLQVDAIFVVSQRIGVSPGSLKNELDPSYIFFQCNPYSGLKIAKYFENMTHPLSCLPFRVKKFKLLEYFRLEDCKPFVQGMLKMVF